MRKSSWPDLRVSKQYGSDDVIEVLKVFDEGLPSQYTEVWEAVIVRGLRLCSHTEPGTIFAKSGA